MIVSRSPPTAVKVPALADSNRQAAVSGSTTTTIGRSAPCFSQAVGEHACGESADAALDEDMGRPRALLFASMARQARSPASHPSARPPRPARTCGRRSASHWRRQPRHRRGRCRRRSGPRAPPSRQSRRIASAGPLADRLMDIDQGLDAGAPSAPGNRSGRDCPSVARATVSPALPLCATSRSTA